MEKVIIECIHKTELLADDDVFNKTRQQEQREFRQSGEQFTLRFRYTCSLCGQKIFMEKVLRKK